MSNPKAQSAKDTAAINALRKYVHEHNREEFKSAIVDGRRLLLAGNGRHFIEVARSAIPGQRLSVTVMDGEDNLVLIVHQTSAGWYQTHPVVTATYPSEG